MLQQQDLLSCGAVLESQESCPTASHRTSINGDSMTTPASTCAHTQL
jgi:hypothetical protein